MLVKKKVYFYEETHLPKKGWFQGCLMCGIVTCKIIFCTKYTNLKKKISYDIFSYICASCKRGLVENLESKQLYDKITTNMLKENNLLPYGPKS